jgi:chitin-binding protein
VTFKTGDVVTFNGARFRCRQGHTSLPGWEPSQFTLALWLPL